MTNRKIISWVISNPNETWLVTNLILAGLVAVLLVWFAFWSNFIVAGGYKENLLELRLSETTKNNSELLSQKSVVANLGALLVFSKEAGLVEQRNIEYVSSTKNLASSEDGRR